MNTQSDKLKRQALYTRADDFSCILANHHDHLGLLVKLYGACFGDSAWTHNDFKKYMESPNFIVLFALENPNPSKKRELTITRKTMPVGFACYNYSRSHNNHNSEIILIGTLPKFRRKGVASCLLKSIEIGDFVPEKLARPLDSRLNSPRNFYSHTVSLDVAVNNEEAMEFYKVHNYNKHLIREKYYQTDDGPIDGIILKKVFI